MPQLMEDDALDPRVLAGFLKPIADGVAEVREDARP